MYFGVEARGVGRDHDFEAALSEVYLYREPEPVRVNDWTVLDRIDFARVAG